MNDSPDITFINLFGEYDLARAVELERQLAEARDSDIAFIDLTNVTYIDSSSIASLVRLRKHMQENGRSAVIRLIAPQENVLKVLRITGLEQIFEVHEHDDEASRLAAERR
ncbi:MAG: STAS domain-containing protein [Candidatus Baltobacteraceae bacterium]